EPRVRAEETMRRDLPALRRDVAERRVFSGHVATAAISRRDGLVDATGTAAGVDRLRPLSELVLSDEMRGVAGELVEKGPVTAPAQRARAKGREGHALLVAAKALGVAVPRNGNGRRRQRVAAVAVGARFGNVVANPARDSPVPAPIDGLD